MNVHGVSFEEAAQVFDDPLAATTPDAEHSEHEPRWHTVGITLGSRLLVVVHTLSESQEGGRIISAREATNRERIAYERDP